MTLEPGVSDRADPPCVIAGKYRLEELLDEGGMGSIWRAFNLQLEVPVAIKVLRPGPHSDELSERLRVEARAAAKLVHPNIIRVFDIGEAESGEPFIVMELLAGESLGDLLKTGALPAVQAVQLLLPIADALTLAHSRGVIHRDLKPDNIFLTRVGDTLQPKLLDFGIAKLMSTRAAGGATLTQAGVLLGSPDYMSPEQANGRDDIDERSDIWSFCIVLYEAISGAAPFSGTSAQTTLRSVVQDDPLPLDLLVDVERSLSDIILSGLAKDRELRPQSMLDLGEQLAAWLLTQGVHEDVTGASLKVKWFGHPTDALEPSPPESSGAPRAQHDQATLVSVVRPRPWATTRPLRPTPTRRRRRWLPGAIVATAGVLGGIGWASLQPSRLRQAAEIQWFAAPVAALPVVTATPVVIATTVAPAPRLTAAPPAAPAPPPRAVVTPVARQVQPAAGSSPLRRASAWPPKPLARDTNAELLEPY